MYRSPRNYSQRSGARGARAYFLTGDYQPVGQWADGAQWQVNAMDFEQAVANVRAGRVVRQRA